eukprot:scaffold117428_cov23-Tisochrysis_lutea.AAC.1
MQLAAQALPYARPRSCISLCSTHSPTDTHSFQHPASCWSRSIAHAYLLLFSTEKSTLHNTGKQQQCSASHACMRRLMGSCNVGLASLITPSAPCTLPPLGSQHGAHDQQTHPRSTHLAQGADGLAIDVLLRAGQLQ